MKAFKIRVQVHVPPREGSAFYRAGQRWESGTTVKDLVVVPSASLARLPSEQRDQLLVGNVISEEQYQGLVDEPLTAVLLLKSEVAELDTSAVVVAPAKEPALAAVEKAAKEPVKEPAPPMQSRVGR